MKNMKSFVSVLLLLCIMMSFVACAGTAEEEIVPDYSTDLEEITFMGADFKFMQKNDEHSTGEDYFGYVVNTEFADLALQRVKEVGAKYDVNIIIETGKDVGSTVQNETYAGLVSADAVQTSGGGLAGILRAGMLYDLTDLSDYIDYTNSEKWGNVENLKPLFWDGALFGVIPAAWPMLKFRSMDGPVIVNEDIIRNKLKIRASISNSIVFKQITAEYGSFEKYLNGFTEGKILYETDKTTNPLSDAISLDLQKWGMKFVGSTIIYSYLQAIGVIYSHDADCYLYRKS